MRMQNQMQHGSERVRVLAFSPHSTKQCDNGGHVDKHHQIISVEYAPFGIILFYPLRDDPELVVEAVEERYKDTRR